MQDMYCTDPKQLHYKEFAERMEFLKYEKEADTMVDPIEVYAEKRAKEERAKIAKNMLAEGMSIDVVVRISKLTEEEVCALAQKQSA